MECSQNGGLKGENRAALNIVLVVADCLFMFVLRLALGGGFSMELVVNGKHAFSCERV